METWEWAAQESHEAFRTAILAYGGVKSKVEGND